MIFAIWVIVVSALAGLGTGIYEAIKERPEPVNYDYEEKEVRKGYLLDGYGMPEREEGDGLLHILLSVFRSLNEQHAAGYRNWLSCCIERLQRGEDVTPKIALVALCLTRDELSGSRFDLEVLDDAIAELGEQTGVAE